VRVYATSNLSVLVISFQVTLAINSTEPTPLGKILVSVADFNSQDIAFKLFVITIGFDEIVTCLIGLTRIHLYFLFEITFSCFTIYEYTLVI